MTCLSPSASMDSSGRVADQTTERLANGFTLVFNMISVNYIDTQYHNLPFEIGVFIIGSLVFSSLFYVVENYFPLLGYYKAYSDNFNMRFFLTCLVICLIVLLAKYLYVAFQFEFEPTLIDIYKKHMHTNPYILDSILNNKPIDTSRRLID